MDSLFLGGILSISSTTIIVRAFDEHGLKGKSFVPQGDKLRVFLVLVTVSLCISAWAKNFCDGYSVPPAFAKIEKDIDKKVRTFSNTKQVASQADDLLSKFISAKSPVIVSWMKKRDLQSKSEDEIAKEWRFYYAKNFVLTKYPTGDKTVDASAEKLVDGILKDTLTKDFKNRIEKLFKQAKEGAIITIQGMNVEKKDEILNRIKGIDLYWPKNLKSARNNAIPLDLIDWGIAYDPESNGINVGVHSLSYPNDETYIAVFAHEIGHSFDSCRWGAYFQGPWPFEKVGSCLRSENSVAAKRRDDSQLDSLTKAGKVSSELAQSLKQNPTCNKFIYPPPGIQADQLPESFADWFSAEVIARVDKIAPEKVRVDLCGDKELSEGSSYPSNKDRLNRIYFAQSKFKSNVPSDTTAIIPCSLETPPTSH